MTEALVVIAAAWCGAGAIGIMGALRAWPYRKTFAVASVWSLLLLGIHFWNRL